MTRYGIASLGSGLISYQVEPTLRETVPYRRRTDMNTISAREGVGG